MKTTLYSTIPTTILAGLLFTAAPSAQAQDCQATYTVVTGCNADGTGWASITNILNDGGFHTIHWNGNEASGGAEFGPVVNGSYFVTMLYGAGCDVSQTFTIDCPPPGDTGCQFRTQTQGGWGSNPHGNNPGTYLAARFAMAFPSGLEIGCTNKLRLLSPAAVRAFLPSGSTARALPSGTLTDPGNSYRNVLAGQLVALTLSVRFDSYDPAFGASNGSLANTRLLSGTFQGWRVSELLAEANRFIGGCPSNYSASQLNAALSMVNENFVDGTTDQGNLGCTSTEKPRLTSTNGTMAMTVLNTPATEQLELMITSDVDGPAIIVVRDAMGRSASPTIVVNTRAGEPLRAAVPISNLRSGSYLVTCQQGDTRVVQRFVVGR